MMQAYKEWHQELLQEIAAGVNACISSGGFSTYEGSYLQELSALISDLYTGERDTAQSFLTNSGTSALEIALRAFGVGVGDAVLLSAYDYPGNFWAVERTGARPLLVDVEPDSWAIEHSFTTRLQDEALPKAVVVSHLHGQMQSLAALARWCKERKVLLVEDCCQSFGTKQDEKLVPIAGDVAVLSFGGGKVFSCGRGGCLVTYDESLYQRIRLAAGAGSGPNHLSELQAAALVPQVKRLDDVVERLDVFTRGVIKELQIGGLWPTCFSVPGFDAAQRFATSGSSVDASTEASIAYGMYQLGVIVDGADSLSGLHHGSGATIPHLIEILRKRGIPAGTGFPGFHRRSSRRCSRISEISNASKIVESTLTIHHSVAWSGQTAVHVGQSINEAVSELSIKRD